MSFFSTTNSRKVGQKMPPKYSNDVEFMQKTTITFFRYVTARVWLVEKAMHQVYKTVTENLFKKE